MVRSSSPTTRRARSTGLRMKSSSHPTGQRLLAVFVSSLLLSIAFAAAQQTATKPAPGKSAPAKTAKPQLAPATARKVTSVEGITEYELRNGLHVLLFPDPTKATVTVNVTYLVGSRLEDYGESGMAH